MSNKENNHADWTSVINPEAHLLNLNLKEVWRYRDLLVLLVKRDFVTYFKQTILGPAWFFINPILTTALFTLVFGNIAGLSTGGSPHSVFYLSGIVVWNYFSTALQQTSTVFTVNAALMGKIYFPRLIMPLSVVCSNFMQFGIQFLLLLGTVLYYAGTEQIQPNWTLALLLTPVLLLLMAFFAFGLGMVFSSMTTKYKDMILVLPFFIQIFMYATPVIYPLSAIDSKYSFLLKMNPLSGIVESFRHVFLGIGEMNWSLLGYSAVVTLFVLLLGVVVFNQIQRGFADTI